MDVSRNRKSRFSSSFFLFFLMRETLVQSVSNVRDEIFILIKDRFFDHFHKYGSDAKSKELRLELEQCDFVR